MSTFKLEKASWQAYFDQITNLLEGKRAEIEVDSMEFGAQIEAEWLPMQGITYDPKSDVVEILLEGLDHLIHKPKTIFVERDGLVLKSLEVIDAHDVRQILRLREPLLLPAP